MTRLRGQNHWVHFLHGNRDDRCPRAPCFAKLFGYLCLSVCICG